MIASSCASPLRERARSAVRRHRRETITHSTASGAKRSALLPDVPTLTEAGIPVQSVVWFGMLAPAATPKAVLAKIREEADEIENELDSGQRDKVAGEIGDLLFAVVNLARHLDVDPESALRTTNLKFERRFASIEDALAARGKTTVDATLAEMDALWDAAKAREKSSG